MEVEKQQYEPMTKASLSSPAELYHGGLPEVNTCLLGSMLMNCARNCKTNSFGAGANLLQSTWTKQLHRRQHAQRTRTISTPRPSQRPACCVVRRLLAARTLSKRQHRVLRTSPQQRRLPRLRRRRLIRCRRTRARGRRRFGVYMIRDLSCEIAQRFYDDPARIRTNLVLFSSEFCLVSQALSRC